MQVMVVMSDGSVVSVELPTAPQDQAEFTWNTESAYQEGDTGLTRAGEEVMRKVTFTAEVLYRRPLDRPEGLCRVGTYGGSPAAAYGEVPGREVPEHVVAMLSQILAGWSPGMVRPGSAEYARAVRGQATLTGQAIWDQAYLAGIHAGVHMATSFPSRVVVTADDVRVKPMMMPLFGPDGGWSWKPPVCTYDRQTGEGTGCTAAVEGLEAPLDGRTEGDRREVILRPCGHRVFLPDPVEVTIS